MEHLYLYLLLAIPLITTIVTTVVLYRQRTKLNKENDDLKVEYNKLLFEVRDLDKPIRKGFYTHKVTFAPTKDSKNIDEYHLVIYVEEIDKYTNGLSKIKYVSAEVTGGYNRDYYNNAIESTIQTFCTIKKTDDIEWLESEQDLKELRKQKIKKILDAKNS